MGHNDIRHKLSEYLDGSVTAQEKTGIEEHLKSCRECSEALSELQKTIEHINTIEELEPPAWMAQKIMTKVRAESGGGKGFFSQWVRQFYIQRPIQAVAVLFLAITAFYIYRNIQPAPKPAEAPLQELAAKKEVPQAAGARNELGKSSEGNSTTSQIPQSQGYKALDMKPEYERPAPPLPADKGAPAPAKTSEQPLLAKKDAAEEKRAFAPQAKSPVVAEGEAASSAGIVPSSDVKQKTTSAQKPKTAGAFDKHAECLAYEPKVITVTGLIKKMDFPGPPKYESIPDNDKGETYWILQLDKPVCITSDMHNDINVAETNVTEMQLVLDAAKYGKLRDLLSIPVSVHGTLFHATTGHHHTSVLLKVSDITAK